MGKNDYVIKEKDLLKFFDAVNMLVANVTLDAKKESKKISADTIMACSKVISAQDKLKVLFDNLEESRTYEN